MEMEMGMNGYQIVSEALNNKSIPTRKLGKTGRSVTILGLGGDGFFGDKKNEEKAISITERSMEAGINYVDTARSYGNSEKVLGQVLPEYRDKIYINTKTRPRTYDGAQKDLETSLKNLQTDHVDCIQLHAVHTKQDIDKIFAKDGALKYLLKAQSQGLTKFIGITSHHIWTIIESLDRFDFDTVLIFVNPVDVHIPGDSTIKNLIPICTEKNVGVVGMKVFTAGTMLKHLPAKRCLRYAMSVPGVHCCTTGVKSLKELNENIQCAQQFKPMTKKEMVSCENVAKKHWETLSSGRLDT
jgi:predicted aldo/keto reductase-like oxidoreductase